MKDFDRIFEWSTAKRTVAFEQNGWFVYYNHNTFESKAPYIAHGCLENKGGWRHEKHCEGCDEPVPEPIRTIYVLLRWSEQGYVDPV